ncbi:MAG: vWA domain-containing protein [Nocardioides sp.]
MKFTASLDVNVVAHEADDDFTVLLELEAPPAPETGEERPASTLQVVLDRSSSMAGGPLRGAVDALVGIVERLERRDRFGVVVFDDDAQVAVPCGPVTDKDAVVAALRAIRPGGSTDLGSGYLRGLQELRRSSAVPDPPAGGTLLIVSDGHVNCGITEEDRFADLASKAQGGGVVTSTLGYGLGYDETLLTAIARSGAGNHEFAQDPDAAGAAIAVEVDGLLNKVVQAASLTIRFSSDVQMVRLFNELPAHQVGEGEVVVELGDFYAQEARKLLMRFRVPAMAALGLAQVATLELRYVEVPALIEQLVILPVTVNVVPGDEAAGRIADPVVRSELLYQEAQQSKKRASEAFERGDLEEGKRLLRAASSDLDSACAVAPDEHRADIVREAEEVGAMFRDVDVVGTNHMSKMSRASYYRQSSKRGRRRPSADES